MDLSAIPAQPSIGLLHVVVEVPAGGRNKYEYLPAPGLMGLDRHWPFGPQRHDGGADRRCQDRRHETGSKGNAGIGKEHRVHGDDEGHCQEGAEPGEKLAADRGVGVFDTKEAMHPVSP